MGKLITFKESDISAITGLLNAISVSGIQNCKQISVIAQILESGVPAEIQEPEKKEGE